MGAVADFVFREMEYLYACLLLVAVRYEETEASGRIGECCDAKRVECG